MQVQALLHYSYIPSVHSHAFNFFLSMFYFMSVHSKVILGNRMHQHLHVHYAPQALAATPLSGHMTILYTLVGMGSAVLAAAVALPC